MHLFDLHCDTMTELCNAGSDLLSNGKHIALDRTRDFQKYAQFFAIWIPPELSGKAACDYFDKHYAFFMEQMENHQEYITFCKSAADMDAAFSAKKCAAFLSVEGGSACAGSLERLQYMASCGVKMMTLTWNFENELACGCGTENGFGLTPFGREAIQEMERLSMLVDVSHLNDWGFEEVAALCTKPLVASHSNARAVRNVLRNLTDAQFATICKRGGLVGLNLYFQFLSAEPRNRLDDVYRHLMHFWDRNGEHNIALGCDFDGADMVGDILGIEHLAGLYDYLLGRNLPEALVHNLFFQNAYNFMQEML